MSVTERAGFPVDFFGWVSISASSPSLPSSLPEVERWRDGDGLRIETFRQLSAEYRICEASFNGTTKRIGRQ